MNTHQNVNKEYNAPLKHSSGSAISTLIIGVVTLFKVLEAIKIRWYK